MTETYRVEWAAAAENDLRRIIDYIAVDSPGNAKEVLAKLRQKASSLYSLPERGRIVPELQAQGIRFYRELVVPPWRIVYRISDKTIYVLAAIDSRRNVEDVLFDRLVE